MGGGSNPAVPGDEPGQCALERPHTLCRLRRYVEHTNPIPDNWRSSNDTRECEWVLMARRKGGIYPQAGNGGIIPSREWGNYPRAATVPETVEAGVVLLRAAARLCRGGRCAHAAVPLSRATTGAAARRRRAQRSSDHPRRGVRGAAHGSVCERFCGRFILHCWCMLGGIGASINEETDARSRRTIGDVRTPRSRTAGLSRAA